MKLDKFDKFYLIGLSISTLLMFLFFIFTSSIINFTFLIFFYVLKFLSGFGLILSISNLFLTILDRFKDKIGKKENVVNTIVLLQVIVPILLIFYGFYKVFSSYAGGSSTSTTDILMMVLDNIIFIYGIASFLLNLYIIPIAKEKFLDAVEIKRLESLKSGAVNIGRGIKKKYFGWRKKYAKVQIQDQKTIKKLLNDWRDKFTVYFLLIIAIGTIVFTPITFICIIFWIGIFFSSRPNLRKYEKIALMLSMIWVGLIASLAPLLNLPMYAAIESLMWSVNISYLLGISLASFIFISKLLKLRDINFKSIKESLQEKKKVKLDKGKSELKQDLKEKGIKTSNKEIKKAQTKKELKDIKENVKPTENKAENDSENKAENDSENKAENDSEKK